MVGGTGSGITVMMTGNDDNEGGGGGACGGGGGCSCGGGDCSGGGNCCGGDGSSFPKSVTTAVAAVTEVTIWVESILVVTGGIPSGTDAVTGSEPCPSPMGVDIAVVGGNVWTPVIVSAVDSSPVAVVGGSV